MPHQRRGRPSVVKQVNGIMYPSLPEMKTVPKEPPVEQPSRNKKSPGSIGGTPFPMSDNRGRPSSKTVYSYRKEARHTRRLIASPISVEDFNAQLNAGVPLKTVPEMNQRRRTKHRQQENDKDDAEVNAGEMRESAHSSIQSTVIINDDGSPQTMTEESQSPKTKSKTADLVRSGAISTLSMGQGENGKININLEIDPECMDQMDEIVEMKVEEVKQVTISNLKFYIFDWK